MKSKYPDRLIKSCAAFGLAAGLGLLAVPDSARAADDNSLYNATFGRVLSGLGFKSGNDKEINYQERPPLVLPSGRDLPPPEKASSEAANPAWPKDPDVKHRKLLEKQERDRPDDETQRRRSEDPKLMTPDALAPGPRPRGVAARDVAGQPNTGDLMSPSELGHKGGMWRTMFNGKNDDVSQFTGEPPRTALTEPPRGYQTPSPDQPYGLSVAKPKAASVDDRVEPKR